MDDLISRAQIEHERDLVLDQAHKAMPCTGEDEELDHGARMYRAGIQDLARRLLALPAASQPEAEPVAWLWRSKDGHIRCALPNAPSSVELACAHYDGDEIVPLYAHPTPAPVVPAERLDDAVRGLQHMLDQYAGKQPYEGYPKALQAGIDAITALRAHQPAASGSGVTVQETGWLPIETASNDTSIIVAYDNGVVALIQADDNDYDWSPYRGYPISDLQSPTHWMPLPEPPALSALEGK